MTGELIGAIVITAIGGSGAGSAVIGTTGGGTIAVIIIIGTMAV
jgi:hypothetical protein